MFPHCHFILDIWFSTFSNCLKTYQLEGVGEDLVGRSGSVFSFYFPVLKVWIVELSNEVPLLLQCLQKQQSCPSGNEVTGLVRSEWNKHLPLSLGPGLSRLSMQDSFLSPSFSTLLPQRQCGCDHGSEKECGRTPPRLALAPLHELCAVFRWPAPCAETTQNKQY